ncbi:hypothetical protein PLICRDRAFT_119367 [Plicaturopsis crispa FD-325 SS-3]|uniref:Helicase ATP-binding domain-containing protein n=1 Tax=Plicaturopsis crispa FD-325 SS-3 TaxID=944288 RepID=A0A0C9SWA3_PLICR|nr:hypothetical protein PLICRDRAFT_119367 [Plicaturopsis crispa FD-325 SS-3]
MAALCQDIRAGKYPLLLVSPEQLSMHDGHLPRMAQLLSDQRFVSLVKRIQVDEAHTIYTAHQQNVPAVDSAVKRCIAL